MRSEPIHRGLSKDLDTARIFVGGALCLAVLAKELNAGDWLSSSVAGFGLPRRGERIVDMWEVSW